MFPAGPEQQAQGVFPVGPQIGLQIAVFTAGPEQQPMERGVARRISAARAGSQDPNSNLWSEVFPARPQLQALDPLDFNCKY